MNYLSLIPLSSAEYSGWSVVLQVSGCSHKCHGCFNPISWDSNAGDPFSSEVKELLLHHLSRPYISNLVLQGGDPLEKRNLAGVIALCQEVKARLPEKRIVLFTGYTIEQLQKSSKLREVLKFIDVLVDGKYEGDLAVKDEVYGSSNQKVVVLAEGEVSSIAIHDEQKTK